MGLTSEIGPGESIALTLFLIIVSFSAVYAYERVSEESGGGVTEELPDYWYDILKDFHIVVHRPPNETKCVNGQEVQLPEKYYIRYLLPDYWYVRILSYRKTSAHHCNWGEILTLGIEDLETEEEMDDAFDTIIRIQLLPKPSVAILVKGSYDKVIYYKNQPIYAYNGTPVVEGENLVKYYYISGIPEIPPELLMRIGWCR